MRANAANRLIAHYRRTARALPWRAPPGSAPRDPYRVWLSEVMLQQTTVAAVAPRFERFVERWPTIEALANAADEDILGEWAGLGYYARARNLIACAREVAMRGAFPDTEADLRELPGIGDYTAAAIAAIAFGQRAVVVDTNVARVVARLHAIERPLSSAKATIRDLADALTPDSEAGDFAQAIMDLGATICRPRQPLCGQCPLAPDCAAFACGEPERFPAPKPRRVRPKRYGTAWWTERGGCVWLVRRPGSGVLGGMAALPGTDFRDEKAMTATIATVRHVFTHFELELAVAEAADPVGDGWWQPLATLAHAGLPTLYRRAVDAVLSQRAKLAA
jgi:A/G-specific adenine glycosylase